MKVVNILDGKLIHVFSKRINTIAEKEGLDKSFFECFQKAVSCSSVKDLARKIAIDHVDS